MSGTIPLSMTQQFDVYGKPLAGGQLYIIQAGTVSTPQDAFQDVALTIKQPYPMTLDAAGRVPQFFLDNSVNASVKVRLQDKNGVVQLAADSVLVIGPSGSGGGTVTPIDPSTVFQTGDLKVRYAVGVHPGPSPGFVRANGRTVGNSLSAATERANADCQALFQHLWQQDATLPVLPSRGVDAITDWNAGKQMTLPDYRGCAISGLDDMGNTPRGWLTAAFFGALATVLGAVGGGESFQLGLSHVPAGITSRNSAVPITVFGPTGHTLFSDGDPPATISYPGSGTFNFKTLGQGTPGSFSGGFQFSGPADVFVTSNNTGGQFHRTIGPRKCATIYIKL